MPFHFWFSLNRKFIAGNTKYTTSVNSKVRSIQDRGIINEYVRKISVQLHRKE